jgi:chromosome segregation ATPase
MVKCELCGKEVKTTQALRGHMNFVHGITGSTSNQPVARPAAEPQVSILEDRLQKLERITGLRESEPLERLSDGRQPLTGQLSGLTQQLNKQADQLEQLTGQLELARVAEATSTENSQKLRNLANQVESLSAKWQDTNNKLVEVVDTNGERLKNARDMFMEKFASAERNLDETREHLNRVEAQQVKHQDAFKSIERTVDGLKADIDDIRQRLLRYPTGNVVTVRLNDGKDHRFREYKNRQGLRRPFKTKTDLLLGDRWVDLAEPES